MSDVQIAQFPTRFKIEFDTINDAFFDMGYMYEVSRILNEIVKSLPDTTSVRGGVREGPIQDHNGNPIGKWTFE